MNVHDPSRGEKNFLQWAEKLTLSVIITPSYA